MKIVYIMINLENKNIIVTGASSGIGEQIVLTFSNLGANIILISRNNEKINKITNSLRNKYIKQKFQSYELDISKYDNTEKVFLQIIKKFQVIDVLINNAGITSDNIIARMSKDQWNNVIDTNLNGTFNCTKFSSKQMMKQKFGKIINISSIIGQIGNKGQSNYSASKAGIIGLTKSLAKELASRNITVNAINPGYIETNMTKKMNEKQRSDFLNLIPLKAFGKPTDVAFLAAFLSSDLSNYITGETINIDGGIAI